MTGQGATDWGDVLDCDDIENEVAALGILSPGHSLADNFTGSDASTPKKALPGHTAVTPELKVFSNDDLPPPAKFAPLTPEMSVSSNSSTVDVPPKSPVLLEQLPSAAGSSSPSPSPGSEFEHDSIRVVHGAKQTSRASSFFGLGRSRGPEMEPVPEDAVMHATLESYFGGIDGDRRSGKLFKKAQIWLTPTHIVVSGRKGKDRFEFAVKDLTQAVATDAFVHGELKLYGLGMFLEVQGKASFNAQMASPSGATVHLGLRGLEGRAHEWAEALQMRMRLGGD
jgi:hypothetical protein